MTDATQACYDAVASRYADTLGDELRHKPLDRALLTAFAEQAGGERRIWDVGCGPGHVTAFLAGLGLTSSGVDISDGMLAQARLRHSGLEFTQGSMLALPSPDASWDGLVSFYSIIHLLDDEDVRAALREFRRVLVPGGLLLLAVHIGDEVRHLDEWFETNVDVSFRFFEPSWLITELDHAGFTIEAQTRRRPYPNVEAPTDRAYLLARAADV